MTITQGAPTTHGRHAGAPTDDEAEMDRAADRIIERLVQAGVPSGLPAGLGDNQGTQVRGAHRAEIPASEQPELSEGFVPQAAGPAQQSGSHLPWRLLLSGAFALLVVLALAFVVLSSVATTWPAGGSPS